MYMSSWVANTAVSDAAKIPVFHIKTLWESSDILQLDYFWSSLALLPYKLLLEKRGIAEHKWKVEDKKQPNLHSRK